MLPWSNFGLALSLQNLESRTAKTFHTKFSNSTGRAVTLNVKNYEHIDGQDGRILNIFLSYYVFTSTSWVYLARNWRSVLASWAILAYSPPPHPATFFNEAKQNKPSNLPKSPLYRSTTKLKLNFTVKTSRKPLYSVTSVFLCCLRSDWMTSRDDVTRCFR